MDKEEKNPEFTDETARKALESLADEDVSATVGTSRKSEDESADCKGDEAGTGAAASRRRRRKKEEDDDSTQINVSLRTILGGDLLAGRWFRRQFGYILLLVAIAIVYVANRYACQQEMIDRINLSDTLLDARYKALTRSSELLERTLRSHVEESLADSTLRTPTTPPYLLKIEEP